MILQMELDPNRLWDIGPNESVYGALVVLLVVIIYYLKKEYDKAQDYVRAQNERIHQILIENIDKVSELKQDRELKHEKVMHVLENIMTQLQKIDKN